MSNTFEVLMGIGALVVAIVSFVVYRSVQRARVIRVKAWIKDFLSGRYGGLPEHLSINCTDDQRWPVLVEFSRPLSATRHRLQFMCSGDSSNYKLASEKEEPVHPAT